MAAMAISALPEQHALRVASEVWLMCAYMGSALKAEGDQRRFAIPSTAFWLRDCIQVLFRTSKLAVLLTSLRHCSDSSLGDFDYYDSL